MKKNLLFVTFPLFAVLFVSGCGGKGSSSVSPTGPSTIPTPTPVSSAPIPLVDIETGAPVVASSYVMSGSNITVTAPGYLLRETTNRGQSVIYMQKDMGDNTFWQQYLFANGGTVLPAGPVNIILDPSIRGNQAIRFAHEQAAQLWNDANQNPAIAASVNDNATSGVITKSSIVPGIFCNGVQVSACTTVTISSGKIISATIVYNSEYAASDVGAVIHELGRVYGKGTTTAKGIMNISPTVNGPSLEEIRGAYFGAHVPVNTRFPFNDR